MSWFKHAFPVDPPGATELSPAETALVDRFAHAVVKRGLAAPVLLILDASQPLNFVASQVLLFLGPVATRLFPGAQYRQLRELLERRGSVEAICQRVEAVLNQDPADHTARPVDQENG